MDSNRKYIEERDKKREREACTAPNKSFWVGLYWRASIIRMMLNLWTRFMKPWRPSRIRSCKTLLSRPCCSWSVHSGSAYDRNTVARFLGLQDACIVRRSRMESPAKPELERGVSDAHWKMHSLKQEHGLAYKSLHEIQYILRDRE